MPQTCPPPTEFADFLPISVSTLASSNANGFSLYIQEASDQPLVLYRDANYPVDKKDFQQLIDRGVENLFVSPRDFKKHKENICKNLGAVIGDKSIPIDQRVELFSGSVRDILSETFSNNNVHETVERTKELACHTVKLICDCDMIAADLFRVLSHDFYTFTHVTNVSCYCVLLAKMLGIEDKDELTQIATGALLHDLGKLEIPLAILNKPGRLTDDEFDVIKRHPTTGFTALCFREDLNLGQLMMVYQHHERLDGSGYPAGVVEDEIHPWAQICAVADVYEALTSNRPYRNAMTNAEAFQILDREASTKLNEELVQCWKSIINNN